MNIRVLEPQEWDKLKPIFTEFNAPIPQPSVATAVIAENEAGEIVGLLMLQLVLHSEPLWIRADQQHNGLWRDLHREMEAQFSKTGGTYYAFSPRGGIAKMTEEVGMEKLPWSVYKKEVAVCHS